MGEDATIFYDQCFNSLYPDAQQIYNKNYYIGMNIFKIKYQSNLF